MATTLSRIEYWLTTPISVLWRDVQDGRINSKLVRVFFLQIFAITLSTAIGVWIATRAVENFILRETLAEEASYFWQQRNEWPERSPPFSKNLRGYIIRQGDINRLPIELQPLEPGFWRIDLVGKQNALVYVSDNDSERLYLALNQFNIWNTSFVLGIAPLAVVLLLIYFLTWLGYISSKRALSPVTQLAQRVEGFDFANQSLNDLHFTDIVEEADAETLSMLRAFEHFTQRLGVMIERERLFTRNASHELRTPIAVIKGNLDLLKYRAEQPKMREQAMDRMQRAVKDMQGLIETLLLLSREDEQHLESSMLDIPELLGKVLETEAGIALDNDIAYGMQILSPLQLDAPEKVISILFANLIRNAFSYTKAGSVNLEIGRNYVAVKDTGIGMNEEELSHAFEPFFRGERHNIDGHGLGLALVARLCKSYNWALDVKSAPDKGTQVIVTFSENPLPSD